jgi:hypothetical protein
MKAVEWSPLWAAMKDTPDKWILTTKHMFFEMLGAMPPTRQRQRSFLVGEPARHNDNGVAVYSCFKIQGGRVYAKDMTIAEYELDSSCK